VVRRETVMACDFRGYGGPRAREVEQPAPPTARLAGRKAN